MIFVDSGALLARYVTDDQYYRAASQLWDELGSSGEILVTSNFVLDETFTLLGRRAGYSFAAERARHIYASRRFQILRPTEGHELSAVDLFAKFADQKISFTDCLSFALMRAERIHRVFSFDRHFRLAGFEMISGNH